MAQTFSFQTILEDHHFTIKIALIGFCMLILLIPMGMIEDLIRDRADYYREAEADISQRWGGPQTLMSPILSIPFSTDDEGREQYAYFLPQRLEVEGRAQIEERSRGIYEVPVYSFELKISGTFAPADFSGWPVLTEPDPAEPVQAEPSPAEPSPAEPDPAEPVQAQAIHWERAQLSMGVSDLHGVRGPVTLVWNDRKTSFGPRVQPVPFGGPVIQCRLTPADVQTPGGSTFTVTLTLAGSDHFRCLPLGTETRVSLTAPWPSPKFTGAYLPTSRVLDDQGFQADWHIGGIGLQYPSRWLGGTVTADQIDKNAFGFDFFQETGTYQQTSRTAKYAVLFFVLTFGVFFLGEVLYGRRIHPIQYLLVGFALCLFYLLLLATAEHIPFWIAYALATSATIGLISWYAAGVLGTARRGGSMSLVLVAVYGYLYSVLQATDYALLLGTFILFAAVLTVMILTRKVDWYQLNLKRNRPEAAP